MIASPVNEPNRIVINHLDLLNDFVADHTFVNFVKWVCTIERVYTDLHLDTVRTVTAKGMATGLSYVKAADRHVRYIVSTIHRRCIPDEEYKVHLSTLISTLYAIAYNVYRIDHVDEMLGRDMRDTKNIPFDSPREFYVDMMTAIESRYVTGVNEYISKVIGV
jgi:hypothetical protein